MKAKYGGVKKEIETMVLLRGIYPRPTIFSIAPEKKLETANITQKKKEKEKKRGFIKGGALKLF